MDDRTTVTRNIDALKGHQGWTDDDLAEVIGLTRQSVDRRRRGSSAWTAADVQAVADAAGVPVAALFVPYLGALDTRRYPRNNREAEVTEQNMESVA